jgi:heme/copper-type cytochrome/quinol oxidase subunit 1
MDYASPDMQLLGTLTSIFVQLVVIAAAVLFLRERAAGAWVMLAGAIVALIGFSIPQIVYVAISFLGADRVSAPVESLMYYSVWTWFSTAGSLVFAVGLFLVALRRRGLAQRIAELETLLDARNP